MSMLDAQRRICKVALFSSKRLAEQIFYTNSVGTFTINAIVEIGPELARSDWNDAKTKIESSAVADMGMFSVLESDIAKPREGDSIQYKSEKWSVAQIFQYDSAGGYYTLICTKKNKAYGL